MTKRDIEKLRERLAANLNEQGLGRVLCIVAPHSPGSRRTDEERVSRFLSETYGLNVAPGILKPLTREDAEFVATELLLGPIWGPRPEDRTEAEDAAARFLTRFSDPARFYSTYNFTIDRANLTYTFTGTALLDNSFDLGILAVDDQLVGVLWMGDED